MPCHAIAAVTLPCQARPMQLRLADIRKRRGLTQEELAERAGMHRSTIARLEVDLLGWTHQTIHSLADALECEEWELFGYTRPPDARLSEETKEALQLLEELPPAVRGLALGQLRLLHAQMKRG